MMMILRNSRFLHVPKCGGNYVNAAIKNSLKTPFLGMEQLSVGKRHLTPAQAPGNGLFTFCFIRHPAKWMKSFWQYKMLHGWEDRDPDLIFKSDSFPHFCRNLMDHRPDYVAWFFWQYIQGSDFVGKQEKLTADLERALNMAGEKYDVEALRATPRRNVSRSEWKAKAVWDPTDLREFIASHRRFMERFGYEF